MAKKRTEREVYECIIHGWVEAVDGPEPVWSGEHQKFVQGIACPIHQGIEDCCGFEMEGPFTVALVDQGPGGAK